MSKKAGNPVTTKDTETEKIQVAMTTGASNPEKDLNNMQSTKLIIRSEKGLNLRGGPHLQYDVLEILPDGAVVTELELPKGANVKDWHLVDSGKTVGWVNARHVKKSEG